MDNTRRHNHHHHGGRGHSRTGGGNRRGRGRGSYSSSLTDGTAKAPSMKKKHVSVRFQELVLSYVVGPHSSSSSITTITESDRSTYSYAVDVLAKALSKRNHLQKLHNRCALATRNAHKLHELVTATCGEPVGSDFCAFLAQVTARKLADVERRTAAWATTSSKSTAPVSVVAVPPPIIEASVPPSDALVFYFTGLSDKRNRVLLHDAMRRYGKALIVADTIPSTDVATAVSDQNATPVIRVRRAFAASEQLTKRPTNKKAAARMQKRNVHRPVAPSTAAATGGGVTQVTTTSKVTSKKIGRPGFSLDKQ